MQGADDQAPRGRGMGGVFPEALEANGQVVQGPAQVVHLGLGSDLHPHLEGARQEARFFVAIGILAQHPVVRVGQVGGSGGRHHRDEAVVLLHAPSIPLGQRSGGGRAVGDGRFRRRRGGVCACAAGPATCSRAWGFRAGGRGGRRDDLPLARDAAVVEAHAAVGRDDRLETRVLVFGTPRRALGFRRCAAPARRRSAWARRSAVG